MVNVLLPVYLKFLRLFSHGRSGILNRGDTEIVVSLTTYPARVSKVWMVIETILRQTYKPDRILLWLSHEQFVGVNLPRNLLNLKRYGLEIRFCNDDLKSHKKYLYSLEEFPRANIVTIDDDLLYPEDMIEKLVTEHHRYGDVICCCISRKIVVENGDLLNYCRWNYVRTNTYPDFCYLIMSGGGTLIPPGTLHNDVFDTKSIKELARTADDLWLKIMSLRVGTKVVCLAGEYQRFPIPVLYRDTSRLTTLNVDGGINDAVFKKLMEKYEIATEILQS